MTQQVFLVPFPAVAWPEDNNVRIAVAGEIDLATSPQLRVVMLAAIDAAMPSGDVTIDLAHVTFIDASGVGVLVTGREAARCRRVGFTVKNAQCGVQRVLDILGLTTTLQYSPAGPRSVQWHRRPAPDEMTRTVSSLANVPRQAQPHRWYTSPFRSWRRPWHRQGRALLPPR